MRIEIEVDGEGRFVRVVEREHLLQAFPAARLLGTLLDAAHSLSGAPATEPPASTSPDLP